MVLRRDDVVDGDLEVVGQSQQQGAHVAVHGVLGARVLNVLLQLRLALLSVQRHQLRALQDIRSLYIVLSFFSFFLPSFLPSFDVFL